MSASSVNVKSEKDTRDQMQTKADMKIHTMKRPDFDIFVEFH